jgi:hypothetical protein
MTSGGASRACCSLRSLSSPCSSCTSSASAGVDVRRANSSKASNTSGSREVSIGPTREATERRESDRYGSKGSRGADALYVSLVLAKSTHFINPDSHP